MPYNVSSPNLKEFCELMSDVSVANATKLSQTFRNLVSSHSLNLDSEYILKIFTFMNFTIATGVWSHIPHKRLRRDLIGQFHTSITLRLSKIFCNTNEAVDIATKAVFIREDFNAYLGKNNQRLKENDYADANTDRLFALEYIQEKYQIKDDVMNDIVPVLLSDQKFNTEIESVAIQMNNVAKEYS